MSEIESSPELIMCFPGKVKQCLRFISAKYLNDTQIKPHYLVFISAIGRYDGLSQKELNERIPVDKSHVSTVVRELIDLGLVYNDGSGKLHSLHLTESGKTVFATCRMMYELLNTKLFSDFSPEEREQLDFLVRKLNRRLDEMIDEYSVKSDDVRQGPQ